MNTTVNAYAALSAGAEDVVDAALTGLDLGENRSV
jgi:hypothetical protein